ncbi:MAG TPA: translocation/assembly module TamB domain-containing protein [Vicinamibacterales bacterium]|nr:translocation/assembly module TamB domain-containing protein [Vicinamibacterales bacterium]
MGRWRQLGSGVARALFLAVLGVLLVLAAGLVALQTTWARNQLRSLIVSQANHYLTATLSIGRLEGSLFRGIELGDVRLARGTETLVAIDRVAVSYSIRELISGGTLIRRLTLDRPTIVAAKEPDGRWNLTSLVRRDTQRNRASGPRRPISISAIEIRDGSVSLRDPLTFGAAHVPTSFQHLNTDLSFSYRPVTWTLDFTRAEFVGGSPDLTVTELAGTVSSGDAGWEFRDLRVVTPHTAFTLDGRIDRRQSPAVLDLKVAAPRFAFQEWAGVLNGLRNIAVESGFDVRLAGPPAALATTIALHSTGGDIDGSLVLDTTVPGWHARGRATVQRLDLARWLNRPDRPSDISGEATLDIDLQLGGHFPRGDFTFTGPHAAYLEYEADDVVARGTITDTDVRIAAATATAYGANVRLSASTLDIDTPYRFHFVGTASGVDLRQVPRTVPVPHVDSTLTFDYDVTGRFAQPYITGNATFEESEFLGARLGAGATGYIDTLAVPFQYAGEGDLAGVDLHRFGGELRIGWMTEPRYAGTVRGRFHVAGTGSELATMVLSGGGRLEEADLFAGRLLDADVGVRIEGGSLRGSYDGELRQINPSIAMQDPLYEATLSGHVRGRVDVRDLLLRAPELNDYTIEAALTATSSVVRGLEVARGEVEARIDNGTLHIARLETTGPGVDLRASGTLELDGQRSSRVTYQVTRSDLSRLKALIGRDAAGQAVTSGELTGPTGGMRFKGTGSIDRLAVSGLAALTTSATYDVTIPTEAPAQATGTLQVRGSFVNAFGTELQSLDADVSYDARHVTAAVNGALPNGLAVSLETAVLLDLDARQLDVESLSIAGHGIAWRLGTASHPRIGWPETGATVSGLELVDAASGQQHVSASGSWDSRGDGTMLVSARGVSLETLTAGSAQPARYGGSLDVDATITGTQAEPAVSADFTITRGRVRRLAYETFGGRVDYRGGTFQLDVRLDQAPGVWLTAAGAVPMSVFDRARDPGNLRVAVKSSPVSLTLLEGVTDVVRNVDGRMELDVTIIGTNRDPHFAGRVALSNASFDVVSSGARYKNGRLALQLASDRVSVDALHVEDEEGHPLDVTGTLGTHELRVGDLQVAVKARAFQVLRNEYGRVDVDADLDFTGQFESPRLAGRITVAGGSLNVDRILDRALFQPYATQAAAVPELDPIVALNPWERLGLNLELHVPGTLRMVGENVQVSTGTPLGLGNINLRAFGDLYLYKDPAQPMYVNGSFDSVSGTYVFQGRRFDLEPSSSILFRGDLNPDIYVTVNRVISGVETRVSILGPLREPELRLASTPPLDPSDILSLIVFNTSTNELSALQQQQLAVRAGTLAAGFLAAPMVSALERTLGIDTLEIEPGADIRGGPRVTVGNEIAPGLVARFSRQFGEADYDEATVEYYLSRILRIRATFSDAGSLTARSPFRRVERAGIDLLLFFSF